MIVAVSIVTQINNIFEFNFNQENNTSDEVFVYNYETNDTIFSVFSGEVGSWEVKYENMCVDEGCYIIAMSSDYWYDGSGLSLSYQATY